MHIVSGCDTVGTEFAIYQFSQWIRRRRRENATINNELTIHSVTFNIYILREDGFGANERGAAARSDAEHYSDSLAVLFRFRL